MPARASRRDAGATGATAGGTPALRVPPAGGTPVLRVPPAEAGSCGFPAADPAL